MSKKTTYACAYCGGKLSMNETILCSTNSFNTFEISCSSEATCKHYTIRQEAIINQKIEKEYQQEIINNNAPVKFEDLILR